MAEGVSVYLECGAKRTFASALDWPGWCRQGRDEDSALEALIEYAPRYASILARTGLGFVAPTKVEQLVVVERLPGTATTDFGAPGVAPTADQDRSCGAPERKRFEKILRAGWRAFDAAVKSARGKTLETGPGVGDDPSRPSSGTSSVLTGGTSPQWAGDRPRRRRRSSSP